MIFMLRTAGNGAVRDACVGFVNSRAKIVKIGTSTWRNTISRLLPEQRHLIKVLRDGVPRAWDDGDTHPRPDGCAATARPSA
jgi:hypothetical protein